MIEAATLVECIAASSKYAAVYRPLVERVVVDCIRKYGDDAEDHARTLLHQIWGSYYSIRPNFKKLEERLSPIDISATLRLHASTAERMPILEDLYAQIFAIVDSSHAPISILDVGCGFNPLTIPYMHLVSGSSYRGIDIDSEEIAFLQKATPLVAGDVNVSIEAGDIASVFLDARRYDVVFLFKLLPVLEQLEKGLARKTLAALRARYIVVSYPVASLSGKEKGMRKFYSAQFYSYIEATDWEVTELSFPTELVFIIDTL